MVAEKQEWPQTQHPRRAGVSSFGFGGTNAHAVIEQAPAAVPVIRETDPAVTTLVLSGKSPERIASQAGSLAAWLQGAGADVRLPDVAHTLNYHRESPCSVRHHLRPRPCPGGGPVAGTGRRPGRRRCRGRP